MTRMKRIFVAAACALPLTLPGVLSAQGAKGMSGSGAENPKKQSRMTDDNAATGGQSRATNSDHGQSSRTSNQGSTTDPQTPRTTRTVEQGQGKNRSSSGDSAGTNEPANDSDGMK